MGKIEEVASAIKDNIQAALPDGVVIDYRYAARAAIEAMSEPNDAMADAAGAELVPAGDFIPGYRAAIRAALNEQAAG